MKVAILGYGKMGKTIERLLDSSDEVVLRINSKNRADLSLERLKEADVAIEFSRPETAYSNIVRCFQAGVPVVSGTTAWLGQIDEALEICAVERGAFFYASNFSLGVNIFFELNKHLAQLMKNQEAYTTKIKEIHHTQKLDAPSGTALNLAETIIQGSEYLKDWELVSDAKKVDLKDKQILPIEAQRISKTPGTHIITYNSAIDTIEIKHEAKSREGFAKGAILAARWLIDKKGVFGMKDLLGFS